MKPIIHTDRVVLLNGDSADLGLLDCATVDAIITDPPAGIGFMGKKWDSDRGGLFDWVDWLATTLEPAYRALKPGGHGFIWAYPKTSFWTALALHKLGLEIRDRFGHIYLNGNPKGLKVGEIGERRCTLLKPACEDWWLVRKPIEGTIAENFEKYGTGYLNLDICRVGEQSPGQTCKYLKAGEPCKGHPTHRSSGRTYHADADPVGDDLGKWPAHLAIDVDVELGFDQTKYLYTPKPSRKERDRGCDHLKSKSGGEATGRKDGSKGTKNPRAGAGRGGDVKNFHPSVKSLDLMRWLIRLITPPGGVVLDPFTGSGSTGVAALEEGMSFIGCEQSAEYCEIAKARIEHVMEDDAWNALADESLSEPGENVPWDAVRAELEMGG
jgi:site-specific DNA-methyltransferase (adenine-specific)